MVKLIKEVMRKAFMFLNLDITKNLKYDRLTQKILKRQLKKNYSCIDVGSHKGEILDLMLEYAPEGKHYAFEPIPKFYDYLQKMYADKVRLFPFALSNANKETTFQFVKNAPAFSGLKKRKYTITHPEIEEIEVQMHTLDSILPKNTPVHFIKIDVEGGEFGVLKGAKEILKYNKPDLLFECGKGATEYYGTKPGEIFSFIADAIGLNIYTLSAFINEKAPLTKVEFEQHFNNNDEYYFIASNA